MPFKVPVGPPRIAIHQAMTVLVTEPDGQITGTGNDGLWFYDTRLIAGWTMRANNETWDVLAGGAVTHDSARIFLANRSCATPEGPIAARCLAATITRVIAGGLRETLAITNHGRAAVRFTLDIGIHCDFADLFDVKARRAIRRGQIDTEWERSAQTLRLSYRNRDFHRGLAITVQGDDADATHANGGLSFVIALNPGAVWNTVLLYDLTDGTQTFEAPRSGPSVPAPSVPALSWRAVLPRLEAANPDFQAFFDQAVEDMEALRLPVEIQQDVPVVAPEYDGSGGPLELPAAGLPWFVAPFGRDSLIVSLQVMPLYSGFARGSLAFLGHWQATAHDPYRDAEPGKIMHELRYGELAHFKLIPHTPYYGTADATPLFVITLHAAWRATGDHGLLTRYRLAMEAALNWIVQHGDRDGDMFQEYQTRSSAGYENMAWKDSGDAIVDETGALVHGPKAVCELQGYAYDAMVRAVEIYDALNEPDHAAAWRARAVALFTAFNEAFWDEASGFYALTLDGGKRRVMSVASNAGHLLWSGLVPPDRAKRVVARLMAPDMQSGWGIRTLSSLHPAYNPYFYQLGAVWPHDNSLIALGFKRYGFDEEAAALARCVTEAASHFQIHQIPELYAGIARDQAEFPVPYGNANVPQAWAAGSCFAMLWAMLGLRPDVPGDRLLVDPWLPDWLPDVTLRDFRVGARRFDIRFWRDGAATRFAVLGGDPPAVVHAPDALALAVPR